ncbi:hypothetical protein K437DRAFT_193963 [Tilletiaria anomala UBC 951]|uniref:Subtilisin-like protein n=1 Tax=Tilletiaria anomala (strain ATCC 24038 / CBS 436.72 / UBC 951) TaxID=1037660 RepID=A0A066VE02_TILAU|nr:uncharacterized protein K437DRAFT_193963 [Tilletiaria anomala UBC 951]KDN39957.1 hypothetical protein K437DRAFT_193963 [Tilletiaria anomala UBC 951]
MDDACKALPLTTDYTGKVVVVGRGTCTFVTKFQNIADRGGEYVLVYNTPYPASITYVAASIDGQQVASLTRDDGLYLKAQYAAGNPIKLDFSHQHPVTTADTNTGGTMSSFSTVTPTWENDIYPGISAPGGNILSTWPIALGEYAIISGTSMATPFVAGSSAMYKSIKGKKSASATQLRTIFSSTANPVELVNSTFHDTVVKQGGGLIDVNRAVFHTTTVSPGSIALNDTRHFKKGPQQITITNSGTKKQTYEVSHLPAATLNTMDPSTGFFELFPVPVVKNAAHIEFSTTKFSLSPGSSKMFSATFKPPKGLNKNDIPIYSGYIQINSTSSPEYGTVQVPYMGVYEDMYTEAVLDTSSEEIGEPLPVLADAEGNIIHDDAHIFTFTNDSSGKLDAPALYWRMRLGSALESVDLISADTKFKPTVPINDGSSSAPATRRQLRSDALTKVSRKHADLHTPSAHESHYARTVAAASDGSRKYSTIKTVGNILRQAWAPRDAVSGISSVQLEPTVSTDNATSTLTIPDGKYKLLLRVRKLFGDADKEADYESYLSHTFEIQTTPASQN